MVYGFGNKLTTHASIMYSINGKVQVWFGLLGFNASATARVMERYSMSLND